MNGIPVFPKHKVYIVILSLCLSLTAAQDSTDELNALRDCAQIENDTERLACYDKILKQIKTEQSPKESTSQQSSYLSLLWELDEKNRVTNTSSCPIDLITS